MSKGKENISFKIGQKVWLLNTKEVAIITSIHKEGLIYVDADGMNIPVFVSDITSDIPDKAGEVTAKTPEPEHHHFINSQELKQTGMHLVFMPERMGDGEIVHYNCYLLNDTRTDIDFEFKINESRGVFEQGHFILNKGKEKLLTHFNADILNDISDVDFYLKPLSGNYEPVHYRQKISASSFMRKLKYFPLVQQEVFVYEVAKAFKEKDAKSVPQGKPEQFSFDADVMKRLMTEKAVMKEQDITEHPNEVDLHAEVIIHDMAGMDNATILHTQLEHFHRALDRAIGSGHKLFYAIHGNGKGVLRKEIEKILKNNEYVVSFNNSYHPRYGFGATEIFLR